MKTIKSNPLKWHGGKFYLARRIINLFPRHLCYVEPYFGGGSVLLARDPNDPKLWKGDGSSERGVSEVVNDINKDLVNFWRVLQCEGKFANFKRVVDAIPLSEPHWKYEATRPKITLEDPDHHLAVSFFVMCRQSLAGRGDSFTAITRNRTRRGMNGNASEWLSAVDGLPAVHERLRSVVILDAQDSLAVIRKYDGPDTLFYLDPPYLQSTRTAPDVYECEVDVEHHVQLLDLLATIKGKFLLSGYRSQMYDVAAAKHGWTRHDFELPNNAAGGESKRRMVECVWLNYRKDVNA